VVPKIIDARSSQQDYARIFQLNLKNGLKRPVTFTISRKGHSCYEGIPGIGTKLAPIQPGSTVPLTIARIQGHGCDGKQGLFAIEVSGEKEIQRFSFDNAGHMVMTNFPDQYAGRLSHKNTYDESYTWEIRPPDNRVARTKTFRIQHAVSGNYLIQGYSGNRDDKRNVEVAPLVAHNNNYRWYIRPAKGGWYNIINVKTGLALTWDGDDANVSNWGLAPHPHVETKPASRRFKLHMVNGTNGPVTYYLRQKWINCYEGNLPVGAFLGPIRSGGRTTIELARVQGHGCDGKQGEFAIQTGKFAEPQRFSFDNAGGLDLVDTPRGFSSKLSPKSKFDESYTWTMARCPSGGCSEVLKKFPHPIGNKSQQWKFQKVRGGGFQIINRAAKKGLQQAYSGRRSDKYNVTVDGGGIWNFRSGGKTDLARLTIESVKAIKTSTGQDTGTQILFKGIEAAIETAISATGVGSGAVAGVKAAGTAAKTAAIKGAAKLGSKRAAKTAAERASVAATKATTKAVKKAAEKAADEAAKKALKDAGKRVWVAKAKGTWKKHVSSQLTKSALKKRVRKEFTKNALAKRGLKMAAKQAALEQGNAATKGPEAASLTELAFNQIYGESPDQLDIHVNGVSVWPNGGRDWRSIKSQQTRAVNTEYIFPRRKGLAIRLVEYDYGSNDDTLGWVFLNTEDIIETTRFKEVVAYSKTERSFYLITFRVEPLEASAMIAEAKKAREKQQAKAKAVAKAKAEAKLKAQVEYQARLKAQAEYQARLKAQAEYQARLKAQAEYQARLKAQAEYQARLKAQAEYQARLKAQAEYQARLKAQAEAAARAKAQAEYNARRRAQQEARRRAQQQRLARLRAEQQRRQTEWNNRRDDTVRHRPTAVPPSVSPNITIVATHSGKCLAASGDIGIVQLTCSGANDQRFALQKIGQNVSVISRASNDCLNISEGSQQDNAEANRYTCDGQRHQQFRLNKRGPGIFNIIASHSGKCLDIPNGDKRDYAPVNQFTCDNSAEQTFRFKRAGGS